MGPAGTIGAARLFLKKVDMGMLSSTAPENFHVYLDAQTDEFLQALPPGAQFWGSARKFLNIFLRDVIYSRHLCEAWPLKHLESVLEVPLDSHVALDLIAEPEGKDLPRWKTVIGLTPDVNAKFQNVASAVARRSGFARIHLDAIYWRRRANQAPLPTLVSVTPAAGAPVAPDTSAAEL